MCRQLVIFSLVSNFILTNGHRGRGRNTHGNRDVAQLGGQCPSPWG